MTSNNSQSFAEFEHTFWNASAQPYATAFGAITAQIAQPLLESVNLKSGSALLDIACGPGYVSAAAMRRKARVTGIDFSGSMVALAKQLVPGVEFKTGDAQNLPFPDLAFDAVVCAFGIMHFSDPQKAFAEAFRVCNPGGRYAFAVWNSPDKSPAYKMILDAIQVHADLTNVPPAGEPFFKYADAQVAQGSLAMAGFQDIHSREHSLLWPIPSASEFMRYFYEGAARTGGILRAQTKETLTKIENEIQQAMSSYNKTGIYEIPVSVVIVSAIK